MTSLMIACEYVEKSSNIQTIQTLLDNNANINIKNNNGRSIFDILSKINSNKKDNILNMLIKIKYKQQAILPFNTNLFQNDSNLQIKNNEDNKNDNNDKINCCVCFEKIIIKCALIPCGHSNICKTCIPKLLTTCPICKS